MLLHAGRPSCILSSGSKKIIQIETETYHLLAAAVPRPHEMEYGREPQVKTICNLRLIVNFKPVIKTSALSTIIMDTLERIS